MPYYHIKISDGPPSGQRKTEYELDLSEEDINKFVEQYQSGLFLFKGRWVESIDLEVEIRETPQKTNYNFPPLNPFTIFGDGAIFLNVTRRFIKSPPRGLVSTKSERALQPPSKNVFIVHGRDHKPMKELKTLLIDLGLNPIVLHEQASGGLTLAEKLERYGRNIGYAFVILTPEDVGGHREEVRNKYKADSLRRTVAVIGTRVIDEILEDFEPRARQNVIFEMGYFWGLLERKKVCCLLKGNVDKPSDIEGLVYVPFNDSISEAKGMILKELREAGYEIKG